MRNIVVTVGVVVAFAGACSSAAPKDSLANVLKGLPAGEGRVAGKLGPGMPPASPGITLTFTKDTDKVTVPVVDGRYQVDLRPGTWSVRSSDGNACATGITVGADGMFGDDLSYPLSGCQHS